MSKVPTEGFLRVLLLFYSDSSSEDNAWDDKTIMVHMMRNGLKTLRLNESKVKSLSHVWLFETPWTVAYKAPLSMEFSRQEYRSGLPFPPPGDPWPRDQTQVSRIASRCFTVWAIREAQYSPRELVDMLQNNHRDLSSSWHMYTP